MRLSMSLSRKVCRCETLECSDWGNGASEVWNSVTSAFNVSSKKKIEVRESLVQIGVCRAVDVQCTMANVVR